MAVMIRAQVNGAVHLWSDEPTDIGEIYGPSAPTDVYLPRVVSLDEVRFGSDSPHGGYVRLTYGSLTLTHEVFTGRVGDWPPPRRLPIAVWYTTAPQHTKLFEGAAQLDRITATGVTYSLRPYDEFTVEAEDVEYKDTLVNIFSDACTTMGLTLDATGARASSPAISYVAKGKQLLINSLHHMASWACHRFWIEDATLYLSDLFVARGTAINLLSGDVADVQYSWNQPYRVYSADYVQPYVRNLMLSIQSVDGGTDHVLLAEAKFGRAQGGTLGAPAATVVSSSDPLYPVANLTDGNTATAWANNKTTNPVGGTAQVNIQIAVATGTIGEYALTARNATTPLAPARWDMYGNNVHTNVYQPMGSVESTGWGALEERRFPVPTDANWPVEVPGSYYYGDVFKVSPSCHRVYSTIWGSLRLIRSAVERPIITLTLPIPSVNGVDALSTPPELGQRINLRDTSLWDAETELPVTVSWMHVDGIGYDFTNHTCQVYGSGGIVSGAELISATPLSVYRFEQMLTGQFLDDMDLGGTANALNVTGSIVVDSAIVREGFGSAYLSQSDAQYMQCADGDLVAGWPFVAGTAATTLTLSLRVRFSFGHEDDTVVLAQKWSSGGFRLVKNVDGSLSVSVWDTAQRTATVFLPASEPGFFDHRWLPRTWYHVVLQLSLAPTTMMGESGRQWALSVFDESRDYWLIYPAGGSFGVSSMAATTAPFMLGTSTAGLTGWVDEVAVFNSILSLDDLVLLRERTYAEVYA